MSRKDLRIAGKLLQPYHSHCLNSPKSFLGKMNKFYGCFFTGTAFWLWLIFMIALLGLVPFYDSDTGTAVYWLILLGITLLLLARVGIYRSYERYLR